MSDPNSKDWLADDPHFVARLNDLEHGLGNGGDAAALDENRSPSGPPPSPVKGVGAPVRPAASAERPPRRPLLDLFPPSALEPERPLWPAPGTAVGPHLPAARPRPAPSPPPGAPSPLDAPTYETFYGLREKAFSLSTDPEFLYQSESHTRVRQALLAAIRERSGVAILTGPPGMGKTMLCRSVVSDLDRRTFSSLVLEPLLSLDDLLKTMLVDFGAMSRQDVARPPPVGRDALTRTLTSFLESLASLQAGAVVIIDQAQGWPVALLEEIGAIAGSAPRTLQVVLVGQPALTSLLKRPELRPLDSSVTHRLVLGPLGADEIAGYVVDRFSVAGGHTRVEFGQAAIARLYELSAGVPRVVNLLCDRALTRGQQSSAGVIDEALIDLAAADLNLGSSRREGRRLLTTLWLVAGFAVLVLAGAAAALWVSRDAVGRTLLHWQNVPAAPGSPVRRLPVLLAPIPPPEISDAPATDNLEPPPIPEVSPHF